MKVKTVIIPVAGKGTRFLPITKSLTKTMFPVVNKPVLQYLIEESVNAKIEKIILVINEEQQMIKDYLDLNSSYYNQLNKDYSELQDLKKLLDKIQIVFIIQNNPLGLGDAIKLCEKEVGKNPFGVILGDDLVLSNKESYGIADLIKAYENKPSNYLGVKKVSIEETKKYGIVKLNNDKVIEMIEKPIANPPSNYAVVGRYIFNSTIFKCLESVKFDNNREIQLTDAINILIKKEEVKIINFQGKRFDIGDKLGYVKANVYASHLNFNFDIFSIYNDIIKEE